MEKEVVLQDDENFFVAKTQHNGEPAIVKRLKPHADEARKNIFQNEIRGTNRFSDLAQEHPEWGIYVPEVFSYDETMMVRAFVEGEELLEEDEAGSAAQYKLVRLAVTLAGIDRVEPELTHNDATQNSAPYKDIRKRFASWSALPLTSGVLDEDGYEQANRLIEEYQPLLQPRYAHGDLSPFKHVFVMPDGKLGLIDFEHFSEYKPRYYDVAYCYSRIYTRSADERLAGAFLQAFLETAELAENREAQLLAIMTQRAIGMHFDACNDLKKGVDYRKRAQTLLALCLTRDVAALTNL